MRHKVVLHQDAEHDLSEIAEWIADKAGVSVALRYAARIRAYCNRFDLFPERGTRRDDLFPGLRTTGFERRITVVFTVTQTEIVILRLLYGGRDIDRIFSGADDDPH